MEEFNLATIEEELEASDRSLEALFCEEFHSDRMTSNFAIAKDLNVSVGVIEQIESIEMKEGFIY